MTSCKRLFSGTSAIALLIVAELIEAVFSEAAFTGAVLTKEAFTEVSLIESVFINVLLTEVLLKLGLCTDNILSAGPSDEDLGTSVLGPTWSLSFAFLALSLSI
ncbi:pentapeptide repeat-containing protein [Treponema denticola]|uniref:pentapeptide repeat-containing protein n=1 Tax=Treponema denticola TaxID=158 RepID=UPI0038689E48